MTTAKSGWKQCGQRRLPFTPLTEVNPPPSSQPFARTRFGAHAGERAFEAGLLGHEKQQALRMDGPRLRAQLRHPFPSVQVGVCATARAKRQIGRSSPSISVPTRRYKIDTLVGDQSDNFIHRHGIEIHQVGAQQTNRSNELSYNRSSRRDKRLKLYSCCSRLRRMTPFRIVLILDGRPKDEGELGRNVAVTLEGRATRAPSRAFPNPAILKGISNSPLRAVECLRTVEMRRDHRF